MKNIFILLVSVAILASCSAPKYSYYFGHRKNAVAVNQTPAFSNVGSASVEPQSLTASTSATPVIVSETATAPVVKKTYLQMNRAERKMLRHQLKREIKSFMAGKKSMESVKGAQASGMDHDLKLAAIFGAVGIVGLLIAGDVFHIIGGIMLLVGVVFFVKWIIRQ